MTMTLIEMRATLMNGTSACAAFSPAKMTRDQVSQYEQAHIFLEQVAETLIEAGDFRYEAASTIDKARRER